MEADITAKFIASIIYAAIALAVAGLSWVGFYILLKHGENKKFGALLCGAYTIVFIIITASSLAIIL